MHFKKRVVIDIIKQGDQLVKQFTDLGIPMPFNFHFAKRLGQLGSLICFIFCLLHRILNVLKYDYKLIWYEQPVQGILRIVSLNFLLFPPDIIPSDDPYHLYEAIGIVGVLIELAAFNIWYFGEAFLLFLVFIMWQTFTNIRNAFKQGSSKSLDKLLELHFQATRMMGLINDLTSPIILFDAAFILFYMGYWLNFTILEHKIRLHHFALFIFATKSLVTLMLQADVHHKAHDVAEWLLRYDKKSMDNIGSYDETAFKAKPPALIDPAKLFLFASQLYGRHDIGFKGYFFFTITPSFVSKVSKMHTSLNPVPKMENVFCIKIVYLYNICFQIAGVILTYTIVITQFYLKDTKCPDCSSELSNGTASITL